MTTYMQCLGCGTVVVNPKIINFMYEKCNYCTQVQREQEERAIDTYLHEQAEKELEKNV